MKTIGGLERTQRSRDELLEPEVETELVWSEPPTEADALSWAALILSVALQHEQPERVLYARWVLVCTGDERSMEYVLSFLSMGMHDGVLHANLAIALG
jgi:hypothetical protein